MLWIENALFPFVVGAERRSATWLLKVFGVNRQAQNAEQYYTPEELQLIVQESEELGALRAESGQMLQELFEFGDLTAGEVMVPRVRVAGIPLGTTAGADPRAARTHAAHALSDLRAGSRSHPRHGPHQGSAAACSCATRRSAATHARPLPLVPETAPLDTVLATMRRSGRRW